MNANLDLHSKIDVLIVFIVWNYIDFNTVSVRQEIRKLLSTLRHNPILK